MGSFVSRLTNILRFYVYFHIFFRTFSAALSKISHCPLYLRTTSSSSLNPFWSFHIVNVIIYHWQDLPNFPYIYFHFPSFFLLLSFFPVYADSLVPLLLNYALLFPQPEELTAEALFLTLFCIPSMSYNLFWVLFAAKMLTQHQFCFHGLTG